MFHLLLLVITISLLASFRVIIQKRLQGLVLLCGGTKKLSISIYSLFFLPGVMLHEIAHFLTAAFLAVPTGEIHIFPRTKDMRSHDSEIVLGSVQVAKADPFRASLVGAAPFIFGSVVLFLITHIIFRELLNQPGFAQSVEWLVNNRSLFGQPLTWLWLYLVLAIANTMFMSKSDMRAWPWALLVIGIIVGLIALAGRLSWAVNKTTPTLISLTQPLTLSFTFAVIVDILMILLLGILVKILEKVRGRRVVHA